MVCVQINLDHHYGSLFTHVSYIYCKLFTLYVWNTVNENSFIISILLLLSQFLSANVCSIFYIDILCVGSTHLHGIKADRLLRKSYTIFFYRYKRLKTTKKWIIRRKYFSRLITIWNGSQKFFLCSDAKDCTK
jgi:hypothetical protein